MAQKRHRFSRQSRVDVAETCVAPAMDYDGHSIRRLECSWCTAGVHLDWKNRREQLLSSRIDFPLPRNLERFLSKSDALLLTFRMSVSSTLILDRSAGQRAQTRRGSFEHGVGPGPLSASAYDNHVP